MNDEHGPDGVGSVGDEAAKLLGALSSLGGDWLKDIGEHVDTGAPECTYCPVCRTVHVFREASPEVRTHLTTAALSLMQAAAGVLNAASGEAGRGSRGQRPVERIDLDDDAWPEDPE